MVIVKSELDRVLTLLRNKIREHGYTQLKVQEQLGWGRSYISQLLTRQKALRVEQVLAILRVVGADPGVFFAELYPPPAGWASPAGAGDPEAVHPAPRGDQARSGQEQQSVRELRSLVRGLISLLADKELIDLDDLTYAVQKSSDDSLSAKFEAE